MDDQNMQPLLPVAYVATWDDGITGRGILGVFSDPAEAREWTEGWRAVNDADEHGLRTDVEPAAYVPTGGRQPDPADECPEETARELAWAHQAAADDTVASLAAAQAGLAALRGADLEAE